MNTPTASNFASALALLLLGLVGCVNTSSIVAANSDRFSRAPEIWRDGNAYRLVLFETFGGTTIAVTEVKAVGDDLHVFATGQISRNGFTRSPNVLPLRIPKPFRRRDLSERFFWRDPDGSLRPLAVRSDPPWERS